MEEAGDPQTIGDNSSSDYEERENLWDQAWPGSGEEETVHAVSDIDNLDEVTTFPDSVGTGDPIEASRDAEPYMAPLDPPVLPGGGEAIHTGTGFGTSPDEETARDAPFRNDADLEDEALLLLRQDSLTSHYTIRPRVVDGVVRLYGTVSDLDDAEHALAIVGEIPGVLDVVDDLRIDPNVQG